MEPLLCARARLRHAIGLPLAVLLLVGLIFSSFAPQACAQSAPFPNAEKAPPLDGGIGWLNVSGPLELKDLHGKWVILDFWTYCCINCQHILPELRRLEKAYPNEVVVIGVHSGKFAAEG